LEHKDQIFREGKNFNVDKKTNNRIKTEEDIQEEVK
jgi:hypothetical protein